MDIRFCAVAIFSMFLLYSFIGNTALLFALHKDQNTFLNQTFVCIYLQLIICAFINHIPQLLIVLPETLQESLLSKYNESFAYRLAASTGSFFFLTFEAFMFLLALTRYVLFNLPNLKRIFTGIGMYLIVAFIWLFAASVLTFEMHSCVTKFNGANLEWKTKCKTSGIVKHYIAYRCGVLFGMPILTFMIYVVMFKSLRRKCSIVFSSGPLDSQNISCIFKNEQRQKPSIRNGRSKSEISVLIQGAIVCSIVELEILSMMLLLKIGVGLFGDKAIIYTNILINCLFILLGAVQPTVYFIYNKRIRHYMTLKLWSKIRNNKGIIAIIQIMSWLTTKLRFLLCTS